MLRILVSMTLVFVAAAVGFWWTAAPAAAHERRAVGQYTFVVGFTGEPAFVEDKNGVDLRVTRTQAASP
ncbi:MAG: hypothetical protein HY330_04815 [Chloroflexi bacterium]|nr:hypothetical protein [Chloroflexota bacterium]